jgi:hypothetical protein
MFVPTPHHLMHYYSFQHNSINNHIFWCDNLGPYKEGPIVYMVTLFSSRWYFDAANTHTYLFVEQISPREAQKSIMIHNSTHTNTCRRLGEYTTSSFLGSHVLFLLSYKAVMRKTDCSIFANMHPVLPASCYNIIHIINLEEYGQCIL